MRSVRYAWVLLLATLTGHAEQTPNEANRASSRPPFMEPLLEKPAGNAKEWGTIPKIVGGGGASPGEYPWMVSLVSRDEPSNKAGHFCGGTLIHPWWIVTAAHCLEGTEPGDVDVVVGATNLSTDTNVQRLPVEEIILHPNYNPINSDSDIALIRLASPVTGISSVPLPLIDDTALANPGVTATATGWGDTTNGSGNYPSILQEVNLPLVSLATANATATYAGTLSANMLAAGFAAGGKDTCSGDSGGPLIVPSPVAPGFMLAGITSFGDGCAQANAYGIYTRVSNFRNWLLGHVLPGYAAHERATGQPGEFRDADGDGLTNFQEYAFRSRGLTASHTGGLKIGLTIPSDPTDVFYRFQSSPDLSIWTGFDPMENEISRVVSAGIPDSDDWTLAPPGSSGTGPYFARATAEKSTALAIGRRPLSMPGGASGTLTDDDPPVPEVPGSHGKNYYFESLPVGTALSVSLRSGVFDGRLQLLDGAGSLVTDSAANNGGGRQGNDELIQFTPAAGITYQIRASGPAGALGDYRLGLWNAEEHAARTNLPIPQTTNGNLTTSDAADPFTQPGPVFLKDDYRLATSTLAAGTLVEISMTSSAIDPYLSLVDAETGGLIISNDDVVPPGLKALLRFVPVPGQSYFIRATTASANTTGAYSLSTLVNTLSTIGKAQTRSGNLSTSSEVDTDETPKADYRLTGATAGSPIRVRLESTAFDAYLSVIDASDGTIVAANDDGTPGRTNSQLTFTPRSGTFYLIRAGAYDVDYGAFTLITDPG